MSKQAKRSLLVSLVLVIIIISVSCFAFIGCKPKADFYVGISQFVQIGALDQAREGFKTKLTELLEKEDKTVSYKDQNANGDAAMNTTIADGFVNSRVDLVYAIATPSAQTALTKTTENKTNIPVIFNAVTDPIYAKLVTSKDENTTNCTGCSDLAGDGLALQFELMLDLEPDLKGIGFIYSTNEDNSISQRDNLQALIDEHNKKVAEDKKITLFDKGIEKQEDLQAAYDSIANKVQIIYMPTDNVVSQNAAALHSYNVGQKKLPIVCGEIVPNDLCGIATYGISYYKLGEKAAEMAADILMGRKTANEIPYYQPDKLDFSINEDVAKELGYTIPQSVYDRVEN